MRKREQLRRELSAILMDTCEEKQMACRITIGESEACGLSSLEMPTVVSAFQLPTEGVIYFQIEGVAEPMEFDDIPTHDLRVILNELSNQIHCLWQKKRSA